MASLLLLVATCAATRRSIAVASVADGPVADSHWWPGICGLPHTDSGECASADGGVLNLPRPQSATSTQRNATNDKEACLALCSGCARCRHVSLSVVTRRCLWFWQCPPLDALTIGPPGEPRIRGYFTTSIEPFKALPPPTPQPALQANSALPAEMAAEGWVQLESALEGRRPECARQACDSDTCAAYRHRRRAGAGAGLRKLRNEADVCPCACSLCLGCAAQVDRWRSPTGQLVHSLVTKTEPPFTFAYNPNDADMDKMLVDLIAEPALTIAWHVRDSSLDRRVRPLLANANPYLTRHRHPARSRFTRTPFYPNLPGCHLALLPSQ